MNWMQKKFCIVDLRYCPVVLFNVLCQEGVTTNDNYEDYISCAVKEMRAGLS